MALYEEFTKTGNWLFRWRSYIPLPLIVFGIILVKVKSFDYLGHSRTLDFIWEIICLFVSFFGLAIRIYTVGHAPKNTCGRNTHKQIADVLNKSGLYSIMRHPLYFGNFFIGLGISMFIHLWWASLIYVLVFWLYYERIMFAEEDFLRKKFGTEFDEWAKHTPAFLPKFSNWRRPDLSFSLKTVLRREYTGFFVIIASLTFLEITGDLVTEGKPDFDLMWIVLFSGGLVTYLILRTLKKKTKILHVKGR